VNVAAANAACSDTNENFTGSGLGIGNIRELEMFVLREQKSFHANWPASFSKASDYSMSKPFHHVNIAPFRSVELFPK
jgi:hypothetical protein